MLNAEKGPKELQENKNPELPTISNEESFGSRAKSILLNTKELGKDVSLYAAKKAPELAKTAVSNSKEAISVAGKEIANGANYVAALALQTLAGEREKGHTFADELKKATPIIGATTKYAQAWRKFHDGKATGKEEDVKQARVDVLISFAEAGLDISLLGAARAAASTRLIGKGITWLTAVRTTSLDSVRIGLMEKAASRMLTYPRAERVVDAFLNTIKPEKDKTS